mmetsp:Transcript_8289/g.19498  ORF Transcript_8289/g.19498 Transcript_8289/m.19498 type:complete len:144 (+) Transcript_8289:783-1214(+)
MQPSAKQRLQHSQVQWKSACATSHSLFAPFSDEPPTSRRSATVPTGEPRPLRATRGYGSPHGRQSMRDADSDARPTYPQGSNSDFGAACGGTQIRIADKDSAWKNADFTKNGPHGPCQQISVSGHMGERRCGRRRSSFVSTQR